MGDDLKIALYIVATVILIVLVFMFGYSMGDTDGYWRCVSDCHKYGVCI